ncbi:MAG: hypothetical protein J4G13_14550 [Dehalococcoidia bacterium]|nr:hypothetical protein [Dehalococcoidia bacterium]
MLANLGPRNPSISRLLRASSGVMKVAFDDHRLVVNAGLLSPVTLAHHLGLGEPVDRHVDSEDAAGRANGEDSC